MRHRKRKPGEDEVAQLRATAIASPPVAGAARAGAAIRVASLVSILSEPEHTCLTDRASKT